jgi:hypothetical protein
VKGPYRLPNKAYLAAAAALSPEARSSIARAEPTSSLEETIAEHFGSSRDTILSQASALSKCARTIPGARAADLSPVAVQMKTPSRYGESKVIIRWVRYAFAILLFISMVTGIRNTDSRSGASVNGQPPRDQASTCCPKLQAHSHERKTSGGDARTRLVRQYPQGECCDGDT